ncbi:23S rRNA (guanosine(2251)-2'-O)-methyltransferase RlmB [Acidihalobacter ferrooxydans]|uniref:23S rRNA (guanosine-2'-O-)-methyltransferase RlmB n=1 Tax=Acidihalobacter ferrooxydans TaxID=1765967 RepID=A0A1P8UF01_9GAMM|nr:23S rRNA (guanosine(2251)-2'-O)-methyltransferase RlmB [Acidihalobacter ferrooxydans]APZ42427.1 23S rRNA (guanosine(2251)-2'-O)-methyltransferase RlmB [Acidihalobacter ferrooxydans]
MSRELREATLLHGINAVESALAHDPERVLTLWVDAGRVDKRLGALIEQARSLGVSVQTSSRKALDRRVPGGHHQGVMADYRPPPPLGEGQLLDRVEAADAPLLLVLDGVTDPHNLGACLRTAAAAGALAVVAPRDRAASLTPVARKAASGAADVIPFVPVTNLSRTLGSLKQFGVWVVGAASTAERELYAQDLRGSQALVLGAEGAGLRRLTAEACDVLVRIPISATMESLNVSVAAGVCLFEAVRQRRA